MACHEVWGHLSEWDWFALVIPASTLASSPPCMLLPPHPSLALLHASHCSDFLAIHMMPLTPYTNRAAHPIPFQSAAHMVVLHEQPQSSAAQTTVLALTLCGGVDWAEEGCDSGSPCYQACWRFWTWPAFRGQGGWPWSPRSWWYPIELNSQSDLPNDIFGCLSIFI